MGPIKDIITAIKAWLAIGMPPDPSDEAALRAWVRKVADFFAELAEKTSVEIDNKVAGILRYICDSEALWDIGYILIKELLASGESDRARSLAIELSEEVAVPQESASGVLCGPVIGVVSPVMILQIVMTVIHIIQQFRDGKFNT